MRNLLRALGLLIVVLVAQRCDAQNQLPASSLCDLQTQLAQGEHKTVRVEGVYLAGLEGDYFVAAGCSERSTYIEFALKTYRNREKLRRIASEPYKGKKIAGDGAPVLVVFNGEFYGPRVPDTGLPEGISKIYHPGWDPRNNSMTKLIVFSIESAKALPPDHPCAAPKSNPTQSPCFQHASAPYKPAGVAGHP